MLGIGKDEARRESELILCRITKRSLSEILAFKDQPLTAEEEVGLHAILERRKQREPLQYILGDTYFWGLRFIVGPGVFIPRPDTECLVEAVLFHLSGRQSPVLGEIGIGSGAISVSLLHSLKTAKSFAVELSGEAYAAALQNAQAHGVANRLFLDRADWRDWLSGLTAPLDALVTNPPYIPKHLAATLAPEVRDWEPACALYGTDEDGLGFYRELATLPKELFKEKGFIALEFGFGQAPELLAIFQKAGWFDLEIREDLAGIPRVLTGLRK